MTRTRQPTQPGRWFALGGGLAAFACVAIASAPTHHNRVLPLPPQAVQPEADDLPEAVVHFRDGRSLEGLLVRRDPSEVVLRVAGIDTTLPTDGILRVDLIPPVEEHYRKLRAVIPDGDIDQLLVLCDWLRDRGAYDLALPELERILTLEPGHPAAENLKLLIENQARLARLSRSVEREPGDETPPRISRPEFPVLTEDQINLIKVYEIDLGDPPDLWVDKDTVEQLIAENQGHELIPTTREGRATLARRPAARILELMFRLQARDYYNRVRVRGEPRAFRLFRDNVHRAWLVNSCASNACHGGQQAGNLWLNNQRKNAESTLYTNFMILDRYRLADGTPLINYENPGKSPLLHMALPREESLYPHPLVGANRGTAWRPVIGSVDDLRFAEAVAWINAMYRPRPEYPVTYEPPRPVGGVPPMPSDERIDR